MASKLQWSNGRSLSGESTFIQSRGFPQYVHQLTWEVKHEIASLLNALKEPTGNDWRLLASRLGFKAHVIHELKDKQSPTEELLELCTSTETQQLLQILVNIERMDVYEAVVGRPNSPTRITEQCNWPMEESSASGLSFPLQDSGHESDLSSHGLPRVPSEQDDDDLFPDDFFSEESKDFWCGISGKHDKKSWKDFNNAIMKLFPDESQQGCMDKFLCHVLKIKYDDRHNSYVELRYFLRLVAWFGPFRPGRDGCLQKMNDLMKDSTSKSRDRGRQSWFAGYMEEENVEDRLRDQPPGYFLIRFSSSKADSGAFVLAVRLDDDVIQVQIENDVTTGQLCLAERTFNNLGAIVTEMRRNILLENCPQLLTNPCPNLPLNVIFKGYVGSGPVQKGRGRGRIGNS